MILAWQRRPENGHQSVTDDLVHDSTFAADRIHHQRVVIVQEFDCLGRFLRLGDRRERTDVAEHGRRLELLAAEREAGRQEFVRHLLRRKLA